MVAISKVLLLATSASALLLPRTVSQIQSGLKTINQGTVDLTQKVNNYNGGVAAAIPVANAASDLSDDIQATTNVTRNTPPVTGQQATTILNYISNTLTPNIKKALNALVAKKSQFTSAGLKGVVQENLNTLRTDSSDLANALIAKAPSGKKAQASSASSSIDALFATAVAAYK